LTIVILIEKGGRRNKYRKNMSWLPNIKYWTEIGSTGEIVHTTRDRENGQK